MKKNIFSSASLFIVIFFISALFLSCGEKEKSVKAVVAFTTGNVQISYPDIKERPLKLKEAVNPGAVIVTGEKAYATLQIMETGIVRINENSVLRADQILSPEKGTALNLEKGEVFSKIIKKKNSKYQVHTKTLVASVRGTEFLTVASPEGRGKVLVRNGVVAVSTESESSGKEVAADSSALVDSSGNVRLVKQSRVEKLELEKYSLQPYVKNIDKASIQKLESDFKKIEPMELEIQKKIEKLEFLQLSPLDRLRKKGLSLVKLYVKDGSQLMGAVEKTTDKDIYLNTGESVITIPKNDIRRRVPVK